MSFLQILDFMRSIRDRTPIVRVLYRALRAPYYGILVRTMPRGIQVQLSSGDKLRLHPGLLGMRPESYEVELTRMLAGSIRPGMTVMDIGAHVGLHTLILSRRVGEHGQVIAVEPSPANAGLLRKHLDWNGCGNVRVVEKAIGDREDTLSFVFRPEPTDPGGFANSLAYDIGGETAIVGMTTIDALCADLEPAVIKIDVEGAEFLAILGAQSTLERAAPLLIIAIHPEPMRSLGTSPAALLSFLAERGYQGRHLDGRIATNPGFEEIVFTKNAVAA